MKKQEKILKLPVSKFINTKFREFSLYTISSRGIPNFYDALTPVQRFILMSAPTSFGKTLSLVGKCMEDGYHHGDLGLASAIAKLTRPFGRALPILEGYGFFGNEVSPDPAAPRYTLVKISKEAGDIIRKYKYLNSKNNNDSWNPFWMEVPLGLCTTIIGIAVAYKALILPRKLSDIKEFLQGKRKTLKPYFQDFKGEIHKYKGIPGSWILSSSIQTEERTIEIRGIPPVMKYSSLLKKLDWLFSKYEGSIRILNNSNTEVKIDIRYLGKSEKEFKEIEDYIRRVFSVIVKESPVFVKDDKILTYDSIEEYLEDFKWQISRLDYRAKEYERDFLSSDLQFNKAKKEFISFILLKKRTISEVDAWLKPFSKEIKSRLESLTSKRFTKNELSETDLQIKELTKLLKIKEKELSLSKAFFMTLKDPTEKRGIGSKSSSSSLFDTFDVEEIDGIYIWKGEDGEEAEDI